MAGQPEMPQGDPAEQAIYWLTWLTSGEAGEAQQRAFERWLNEKPAHRKAWENARSLWQDVTRLTELDLVENVAPAATKVVTLENRRRPVFHSGFALAVCMVLCFGLWMTELPYYLADYRTGTGDSQMITLADGSKIQLNTGTAVSVDYSASIRRLILHGGEAWFQVAPDPNRPFEVTTDYGAVRALGTAFDIYQRNDQVTVTVYEHAVEVQLRGGEKMGPLAQGSALVFDRSIIHLDRHTDLAKASAWHQRRMAFQGCRLQEVIEELNRYRKGRIIIADRTLNDLPLTGVFDTGDPEEALQMIRQSLKLSEYRITDRLVFLYR